MSFWHSDLGEITGNAGDAFAKTFKQIPDGTMAIAKIDSFINVDYQGSRYLNIDWILVEGDFKGQKVSQKIKVFDGDPKVKHRALNMLKLLYEMFKVRPKDNTPPSDDDLLIFTGKQAGIKIRETEPNDKGKQYNWVAEVHPGQGFKSETGIKLEVTHVNSSRPESSLNRAYEAHKAPTEEDGDIPF